MTRLQALQDVIVRIEDTQRQIDRLIKHQEKLWDLYFLSMEDSLVPMIKYKVSPKVPKQTSFGKSIDILNLNIEDVVKGKRKIRVMSKPVY